jgi:hypothetical protein
VYEAACWIANTRRTGPNRAGEFCKSVKNLPPGIYFASHPRTKQRLLAGDKSPRRDKGVDHKRLERWLKRLPTDTALQAKVADWDALLIKIAGSNEWLEGTGERWQKRWEEVSRGIPQPFSLALVKQLAPVEMETDLREQARALAVEHNAKAEELRLAVKAEGAV